MTVGLLLLAMEGCDKKEAAKHEMTNLDQLREALPEVRVEAFDPKQLENLGPSAVPGILAKPEIRALARQALAGDGSAAYKLFHHFNLVGNESQSLAWTRIGAENGEYNSMMNMGFESAHQGGLDGCVRAIYWFTRAKGELKKDQPSATDTQRSLIEMLSEAADEEIAKARGKTKGC